MPSSNSPASSRGGYIQSFGCMIAVDESTFRVIAYSENVIEMLELNPQSVPILEETQTLTVGTDVRTIFAPSSYHLLEKAFGAREITLLNPLWIHSKSSGKRRCSSRRSIAVALHGDRSPLLFTEIDRRCSSWRSIAATLHGDWEWVRSQFGEQGIIP
ncbi:phytochrome B-like [Macadamia integrifolia]|uniref:phytochrome B-like n=1 Tax=Macadamia integrifolia TaxID=60698 RepID=UPI001C528649|nr:phytochrome B-like [Macadamia integrifolia]